MKKIFTIGFLFLFGNLEIIAQDANLYQGPSDIYLRSGSVLKHITLWKIDTVRVEYVDKGSLTDMLTEEILRIATRDYEIAFDEQNHPVRKTYDLIIKGAGDTLRGFVVEVINDRYVAYTPTTGKGVKETACNGFILSGTTMKGKPIKQQPVNEVVVQTPPVAGNVVQAQTIAEKSEPTEVRAKAYPSAKNNRKNKDMIVTKWGDTILCRILKSKPNSVEYSIMRIGHDTRVVIPKKEVLYINDAEEPKSGWKVPVTIVAIIGTILAIQIAAFSQ